MLLIGMKNKKSLLLAPAILAISLLLLTFRQAQAASIVVNSLGDTATNDGVCTLKEAIVAANLNTVSGKCAAGSARSLG